MTRVVLLGVPSSAGARRKGQEGTPQLFRKVGLSEGLRSVGLHVVDYGDLPRAIFSIDTRNPKQQNIELVTDLTKLVADRVYEAAQNSAKILVLGGDCTITLGVVAGLGRVYPDLGLMYFDGDVDLNTPDDTTSGILDGMGMAHILGKGADELTQIGSRIPLLPESKVVLFGFNAAAGWIDPPETQRLKELSLIQYAVNEIRGRGEPVSREACAQLEARVDHILVHFDVDVIDFRDFPAADVPHEYGLSFGEAMDILRVFVSSRKFAGLVITEFNAGRDVGGKLARRLVRGVAETFRCGRLKWEDAPE